MSAARAVTLSGIPFESPLLLSSAPPTENEGNVPVADYASPKLPAPARA
jgi:hypothetical protein